MGIEVLKCPSCSMRYNSAIYDKCPYCSGGTAEKSQKKEVEAPKSKFWAPKKKAEAPVVETVAPVQEEPKTPETEEVYTQSIWQKMGQDNSKKNSNPEAAAASEPEKARSAVPVIEATPKSVSYRVETKTPAPAAPEEDKALSNRIQSIGKTTAKFISVSGSEVTYPVVGWLVAVKGVYYGKAFPLRSGINRVGRSADMEIALVKDQSVSSQTVVKIVYDTKANAFQAMPGDSTSLCYVDGNALYERQQLKGYEKIEMGDSEENLFVFIPLCGENFRWDQFPVNGK